MKREKLTNHEAAYVEAFLESTSKTIMLSGAILFGLITSFIILSWLRIEDLFSILAFTSLFCFTLYGFIDLCILSVMFYIRVGFHPSVDDISNMFWYFWVQRFTNEKFSKSLVKEFFKEFKAIRKIRETQQLADSVPDSKDKRNTLNKMYTFAESLYCKYQARLNSDLLLKEQKSLDFLKRHVDKLNELNTQK